MYGYKFLYIKTINDHIILEDVLDVFGILALVKLEIPDDAKVIYPVDMDYYKNSSASSLSDKDFYNMDDYVKAKKCRCNKAKVVEIIKYFSIVQDGPYSYTYNSLYEMTCDLEPSDLTFKSMWNPNFIYKFDEYVEPDSLDEDILWRCSNGIHFCRTVEDAIDYIERDAYYTIIDRRIK